MGKKYPDAEPIWTDIFYVEKCRRCVFDKSLRERISILKENGNAGVRVRCKNCGLRRTFYLR